METVTTAVTVTARDILNLAFTFYCAEDGAMSFSIDLDEHCGISEILLRSVLKCYGDYKIEGQSEYTDSEETDMYGNHVTYEIFHTNLPKEKFIEVVGDDVWIGDLADVEDELVPID